MTTRRDVLKVLAALGVSVLGDQPAIAAQSEEWRHKEGGVYVMPDIDGASSVDFLIHAFGRDDGEPIWGRTSEHLRGVPQADGSMRMERRPPWFERNALRDPGAGYLCTIPSSFVPMFLGLLVEVSEEGSKPLLRAVARIDSPADDDEEPLDLSYFNGQWKPWRIMDDRAEIADLHAPFTVRIRPEERPWESYLAIIDEGNAA